MQASREALEEAGKDGEYCAGAHVHGVSQYRSLKLTIPLHLHSGYVLGACLLLQSVTEMTPCTPILAARELATAALQEAQHALKWLAQLVHVAHLISPVRLLLGQHWRVSCASTGRSPGGSVRPQMACVVESHGAPDQLAQSIAVSVSSTTCTCAGPAHAGVQEAQHALKCLHSRLVRHTC